MTALLPIGTRLAPAPAPAGTPPLELVGPADRSPAARRRRARVLGVLLLVVVAAALFGLVASHVALTQGQFRLQTLRQHAEAEQARYERLRLQVAELESPARVVAAAQERLGMVPPPGVTYLSPAGPASGPAADDTEPGQEGAATADWSSVKRQLASRP